jgi:hypothetical protein
MRDNSPVDGYLSRNRAIIEAMRIGLSSADMLIPEMHRDG